LNERAARAKIWIQKRMKQSCVEFEDLEEIKVKRQIVAIVEPSMLG
jgi:hypothetical protein